MSRSKRDAAQIQQFEHDEVTNSKRVRITDTEMSMELSHADGDSVTSHPHKLSASVEGVGVVDDGTVIIPALDCSSLRSVRVEIDGSGSVVVEVSMSDTHDHWVSIGAQGSTLDITARRIRVKSVDVVGDVHLAGRS